MWDLPGPGLGPVSPALAGGFLTTAPPGKPQVSLFNSPVALCPFQHSFPNHSFSFFTSVSPTPGGGIWSPTIPRFISPLVKAWDSTDLLPNPPAKRLLGPVQVGGWCPPNLLWWGQLIWCYQVYWEPKGGYNHVNLCEGQVLEVDGTWREGGRCGRPTQ